MKWEQPVRPEHGALTFLSALLLKPEFRSLIYVRLRSGGVRGWAVAKGMSLVYRPQSNLHVDCSAIGGGLYFEHGFATVVNAESIGPRCWINQQVTIGVGARNDRPTIGADVKIRAGAIVLGGVTLGDGCQVLAGAVVTKDVPAGESVAGVPARVVARSGR